MRRVIVALIAVALAVAVFVLWPRSDGENPSDPQAGPTTTTTTLSATTTTAAVSTTTSWPTSTVTDVQVVETVEEAEAILRDLWFGWFEGIYNQDEARIREVVASQQFLDSARSAFGDLQFIAEPTANSIQFDEIEILESSETCLAVWNVSSVEFLESDSSRSGVEILREDEGMWKFVAAWRFKNDLWEADCDAQLLPLS
ncbi:MAG TPA: hypothetical protein VFS66_10495 [Acidimicrobiia bacterium]|nr:hypothetical protein [Acidimicrobiia bacterium]